ncbi:MAG: hypothetical protein CMM50_13090 [Rhodospirillaceae bacterium]|nr:hypothetical protein [Rhodospirillaceae bacterium]
MDDTTNRFKQALAEGRTQIGLWSSLCSNIAAEIVSGSGFDWIVVDLEHAPNDIASLTMQLQAMKGGTATPVVRPYWNDMPLFKRILDAGAQSLICPYVQNAEEAAQAVSQARYPLAGVRGVASSHRGNQWGRDQGYFERANKEMCVLAQLETAEAVAELEKIAAVDGIDGVFVGPSDLSASLGHIGRPNDKPVQDAIADFVARARKIGKPAGILTGSVADAHRYLEMGFTFVAVGNDATALRVASDNLAKEFAKYRN